MIDRGLRWRDAGTVECPWEDVWAVLRTQPWDSPLSKSMKPDEWFWYDPAFPVLVETRDLLRVIATKQPMPQNLPKERIPKMTLPPWAVDKSKTVVAPEPVTLDEIDAHLVRLNGARAA